MLSEPKITKAQMLHFLEDKFAMADRDHDGALGLDELTRFLRAISHPDLRALQAWERYTPH